MVIHPVKNDNLLYVLPLTFRGAEDHLVTRGKERFLHWLEREHISFEGQVPDILFFLTGGSEADAIKKLNKSKLQLLVAFGEDNAYASATEVQAYAGQHGYNTLLLSLDDRDSMQIIRDLQRVKSGLKRLKGQTLGLIGEVSEWLVASTVTQEALRERLGIRMKKITWHEAGDFRAQLPSMEFINKFDHTSSHPLTSASKVLTLLKGIIATHHLDAITVECFSLVQKYAVTACLALSDLNDHHIPAGCEGDLASIAGMMLLKEIAGHVPWMANLAGIKGTGALFAHCTAPTDLLADFSIQTHFETDRGTAIQGYFEEDQVTLFRLDNKLSRAFLATGTITDRPTFPYACRTQIQVELPPLAAKSLKENPLGNHHLILPGDQADLLRLAMQAMRVAVVDG
jgi:L-fucose isomerase-like protein